MKIHDTLSNKIQELDLPHIRIYLCGVTTYDKSHIGHARTIIVFDVLRRYLEDKGIKVELVQNFTDIDDKIINRASDEQTSAKSISTRYIKQYHEDFDSLHVKRAANYPMATEHISDIISFIESLVQKGVAYTSKNGVYFAVSQFPEYGKLSKKDIDQLEKGARVKVDDAKKDPLDFALWKFSDIEPVWNSPWGKGRPGWHIECSVMSTKYLGEGFEIHGGGRDLIFPHHENEIAQSESYGNEFAKMWMHVGMVTINGEKMSKSLGNMRAVKSMLDDWGPNVIRLFCLSGHYSKPIDYTTELLNESLVKWRQIETCYFELIHADGTKDSTCDVMQYRKDFDHSLEDDLNTHMALSAFFQMIKMVNNLASDIRLSKTDAKCIMAEFQRMIKILGLYIPEITPSEKEQIDELIKRRKIYREQKQFDKADSIRDQISKLNIELLDHKGKTVWVKRQSIKAQD